MTVVRDLDVTNPQSDRWPFRTSLTLNTMGIPTLGVRRSNLTHPVHNPTGQYSEVVLAQKDFLKWAVENQRPNRNIRSVWVNAMSRDMREGRWVLHHQGIAFDEQRRMLDGQHRCMAALLADVPMLTYVSWNVPEKGCLHVDDGAVRSYRDALIMMGKEAPAVSMLAVARNVEHFPTLTASRARERATNDELAVLLLRWKAELEFQASALTPMTRGTKGLSKGLRCLLARAYRCLNSAGRDRLLAFAQIQATGVSRNGSSGPSDLAAHLFKTWNGNYKHYDHKGETLRYQKATGAVCMFLRNEPVTRLSAATDDIFPIHGQMDHQRYFARKLFSYTRNR